MTGLRRACRRRRCAPWAFWRLPRASQQCSIAAVAQCACQIAQGSAWPAAAAAAAARLLTPALCRSLPLPAVQVPTFQPTQGDAVLGLDAALSQLAFQEAAEGEAGGEEQPAELPEWACA